MALGHRGREQQQEMWVSAGHVFYGKLNEQLADAGVDRFVENLCQPYYHVTIGRPAFRRACIFACCW